MRPYPVTIALMLLAAALYHAAPTHAAEEPSSRITLSSGKSIQLETMGLAKADDGWAITFSYVTDTDLQDTEAVVGEAVELFSDHFKKLADLTEPVIIATILYAYDEPWAGDGQLQVRLNYATVFMRQSADTWSLLNPED